MKSSHPAIIVSLLIGIMSCNNQKNLYEFDEVPYGDPKFEHLANSPFDSLSVFKYDGKRGYYDPNTNKVVIPAQYRRAWVFSEGLAAVQKGGMIGFIDHNGNTIIDFKYPYHGNSLLNFIFSNGKCVVADSTGMCGVINKKGEWIIKPQYQFISIYKEYMIVENEGRRMQVAYDGTIQNPCLYDFVWKLTVTQKEKTVNSKGEISYVNKEIDTDYFCYSVGEYCGLMDSSYNRLTEAIYRDIKAITKKTFSASLLDYQSKVILNSKGQRIL